MIDIFISHIEEDATVALEIALGLEENGCTIWCYELDSIPGPSYLLQTGRAIEEAQAFVLVISPHSLGSNQVTKELVRAYESNKPFVPVLHGITHTEFKQRQPMWRQALGASTSISIPQKGGIASILPRIIDGLRSLGIHPRSQPDAMRIGRIRNAIEEQQEHSLSKKDRESRVQDYRPYETVRPPGIPDAKTMESCVNCGRLVSAKERTVMRGKIYCNHCLERIFYKKEIEQEVTYNTALRVISVSLGFLMILGAIEGLKYYAESGLVAELIVDIITIITALGCFLIAIVPQWVSAKLGIKLENNFTFFIVLAILVFMWLVAMNLGPEPPGGW